MFTSSLIVLCILLVLNAGLLCVMVAIVIAGTRAVKSASPTMLLNDGAQCVLMSRLIEAAKKLPTSASGNGYTLSALRKDDHL